MKLAANPYFSSFSTYPNRNQCYLHVKDRHQQTLALSMLQANNVVCATVTELNNRGVIRIDGDENIIRVLQFIEDNNWLAPQPDDDHDPHENEECEYPIDNKGIDRQIALDAAKNADLLLLQVLLGNGLTNQDYQALINARIVMDSTLENKYRCEFMLEALMNQIDGLNEFLSKQDSSQAKKNSLVNHLRQCVYDAKEVMLASKLTYFNNARIGPQLPTRNIDSFAQFEAWLREICLPTENILLTWIEGENPSLVLENLITQFEKIEIANNHLQQQREETSIPYMDAQAAISRKLQQHASNIDSLLARQDGLPIPLRYHNDAEKQDIKSRLLTIRIDPNTCDQDGNSLMHIALKSLHEEVADILYRYGASYLTKNKHGLTVAEYAGINLSAIRIKKYNKGITHLKFQSKFMSDILRILTKWEKAEPLPAILSYLFKTFTDFTLSPTQLAQLPKIKEEFIVVMNEAQTKRCEKMIFDKIVSGLKTHAWFYESFLEAAIKFSEDPTYGLFKEPEHLKLIKYSVNL